LNQKLLGLRIRQARERLRISQEEFAALVTKDQRAISEYENGKRKLPAIDLPLFAQVLQVPLTYFFEEEAGEYSFDQAVVHYLHQLPTSEARQAAVDIMRLLTTISPRNTS
jgi:transcriptional regulator with XRE-family HTH domain